MKDLSELEKKLGVTFKNKNLLKLALIHRSYLNENPTVAMSNERLEFLGDSVLSLLVSSELFEKYPTYPEGKLTSLRSALVRAKTLGDQAEKLELGNFLFISRGEEKSGGRENKSLLANTFEAVVGAIYLDQGLETAKNFLSNTIFPLIDGLTQKQNLLDFKSAFQELTQEKLKLSPLYRVLNEQGPDHAKIFQVGVFLDNKLIAKGEGKSKQEAEQAAAKVALETRKL